MINHWVKRGTLFSDTPIYAHWNMSIWPMFSNSDDVDPDSEALGKIVKALVQNPVVTPVANLFKLLGLHEIPSHSTYI